MPSSALPPPKCFALLVELLDAGSVGEPEAEVVEGDHVVGVGASAGPATR